MTYVNPVFRYGYDNFFKQCSVTGIDGIIIPDLPFEEKNEISEYAKKYDIKIVSLIAPTSQQRIEDIAKEAEGFLYVVSSMGVTGERNEIKTDLKSIIESVKRVTNVPTAIGFGIHSPQQANQMSKISDGVIVGSAIIKIIKQHGTDADSYIYDYVKSMKDSMNN